MNKLASITTPSFIRITLVAVLAIGFAQGGWADPNNPTTPEEIAAQKDLDASAAEAQAQLDALSADRDAKIQSILHEWSSFMDANGIDAADVQEGLEALSDVDLDAASKASSFGEIQALFGEIGALAYETPNALADLTQDLVFVPLPPCRVVDTRNPNGGGAFFPGQTRSFWVTDDGAPFNLTQGGFAGSCGVPNVGATEPPAVVLNITAANATTNGYFTVWAFGQPQPLASILNYTSNHPNANAAILPSAVNIGQEINVFSSRSTHLIIDVIGYFKPVDSNDAAFGGVDYAGGNQNVSLGAPDLTVRSIVFNAPAAGYVAVTASGYFANGDAFFTPRCSITTGVALDFNHLIIADAPSAVFFPFSGTRGFSVGTGNTTFRLVCDTAAGAGDVRDTNITAVYSKVRR